MQEFFQSEQYKHFWLFLVKSGFTVGLLSVTCSVLPALLTFSFGGDKTMLIAVFIFGFGYGLIAALLGYILIFTILKITKTLPFQILASVVGIFLEILVLTQFYTSGGMKLTLSPQAFFFPVLPALLSLVTFVKFAQKHIRPFV